MSSVSGDENNEVAENEPVRRTRSGRAVKAVSAPMAKKTPIKKPATRITRVTRNTQEVEEETSAKNEEESGAPENGVQQETISEEQDTSIHLKLDETQEQVDEEANDNDNQTNENEEQCNDNQEEQFIENQDEQFTENQDAENQEEQFTENQDEQSTENQEEQFVENEEEQFIGNQEEQLNENQEEQINEYQDEQMNEEFPEDMADEIPEQGHVIETDNLPEFDPEEVNEEANEEANEIVNEEEKTEAPTEMETDSAKPNDDETDALNKDSPEAMKENEEDEQCILIEDDVDQQLETKNVPDKTNTDSNETSQKDSVKNNSSNKSKNDDSEIIPDNDQFRNEDVEFISETNDNALENYSQDKNQDDDDVIEISDHESESPLKKNEPDTEAVSEDELPTEATTKRFNHEYEDVEEVSEDEFFANETVFQEPETEAVSDEELPAAQPADLGETESVSDDELPVESEKKRKSKTSNKVPEKKTKTEATSKRKRPVEGEYDPSSPTSENNDETPAKKVAVSVDEKTETKPASPKKKILPELEKYWKAVNDDPADFTGWTYLLQYVDQENDAEAAREAYNKFLERYPYCYGYWRKYADYEKKKGDPERVQTVFDQGLKAISLSVDLWLHYINHCKVAHEKDEEKMREQYERAIKACGLEFRSDRLWESYIKWETENKRYNKVMNIYDRLLCTPTLGYMTHFETFQEFVTANSPNRILSVDDFLALRAEVKAILKPDDNATSADDAPPGEDLPPNETPPTDEETRAIREKIISSRRKMHKTNVNAVAARWSFEEGIKRPYFHVKPLERCQLKNWKEYLDYEIEQKDQNRIVILFERCLIACALYDEFWLRFVRYLESLKGDNTEKIRDVYTRACTVHHPKKPNLHLQWATFEESLGNCDKAATILENIDSIIPNMLQIAYRRINLERRRGELDKACSLYEHYIGSSKNRTIANNIVVKYARFLCKIKNDTDKAVKVLIKATEKDKDNPRLYLQLIDIGLQRNPIDTQEVISYMDLFIDREHADAEQRVLFAQRKVEFLEDFSTDIRQVLKAHEQFQKCIKQAKERKKTKNEDKIDATPPKKAKADTSSVPPAPVGSQSYQYSSSTAPYQSQQQFQSGQYGSQSGYQQGYQQYPPPSDPNYANYQNWQYGQSGPQAYAPYNQWGSYNYY